MSHNTKNGEMKKKLFKDGSRSDCGSGGRRFESGLPPFFLTMLAVFSKIFLDYFKNI